MTTQALNSVSNKVLAILGTSSDEMLQLSGPSMLGANYSNVLRKKTYGFHAKLHHPEPRMSMGALEDPGQFSTQDRGENKPEWRQYVLSLICNSRNKGIPQTLARRVSHMFTCENGAVI